MQFARLFPVLAVCGRLLCALPAAAQTRRAGGPEAGDRVLRVARASLDSADAIRRTIAAAAADGATAVLVPVALGGPAGLFDGAAAAVREARERGLRAYAWVHVSLASWTGELPASRDHVMYRHPEWLMVPRELAAQMLSVDPRSPEYVGRLARWARANADRAAGVYVSALHPDAADYLVKSIAELIARYDVHGIHLDALPSAGDQFDFSRSALEQFRAAMVGRLSAADRARMDAVEQIDPFAYPEEYPDDWQRFRAGRGADLVRRLRAAVQAVRPSAIISAEGVPDAELARLTP